MRRIKHSQNNISFIKNKIMKFFQSMQATNFLLTPKQIYKVFSFKENLSCNRKDFLSALGRLIENGFLRAFTDGDKIYYELNHTRFKMDEIITNL